MNASKSISASVKARLQNVAATRGEDFNLLLLRYGIERLLPRFGLRQGPEGQFDVIPGRQHRHRFNDGISVLPDAPPIRGKQDKYRQSAAGKVLLIAEILIRCDDGGEALRLRCAQ